MKRRLGFSTLETGMYLIIVVLAGSAVVGLQRATGRAWQSTSTQFTQTETLARALQKIGPTLRSALRVNISASNASKITVVMPLKDAQGQTVVPFADGDTIAFYCSDVTGLPSSTGGVLWRSVNGVKDAKWSLRSGSPAIDFGNSGMALTYF